MFSGNRIRKYFFSEKANYIWTPSKDFNLELLPTVYVEELKRVTDHSKDKVFMDCGMMIPRVCFFTGMSVRIFSAVYNSDARAYTLVVDAFYFNHNKYRIFCQKVLKENSEQFLLKALMLDFDFESDKTTLDNFKRMGGCYGFVDHVRYIVKADEGCSAEYHERSPSMMTTAEMRTHLGQQVENKDCLNLAFVTWYDSEGVEYRHFVPIWYDEMTTEENIKKRLQLLLTTIVKGPAEDCGMCSD